MIFLVAFLFDWIYVAVAVEKGRGGARVMM